MGLIQSLFGGAQRQRTYCIDYDETFSVRGRLVGALFDTEQTVWNEKHRRYETDRTRPLKPNWIIVAADDPMTPEFYNDGVFIAAGRSGRRMLARPLSQPFPWIHFRIIREWTEASPALFQELFENRDVIDRVTRDDRVLNRLAPAMHHTCKAVLSHLRMQMVPQSTQLAEEWRDCIPRIAEAVDGPGATNPQQVYEACRLALHLLRYNVEIPGAAGALGGHLLALVAAVDPSIVIPEETDLEDDDLDEEESEHDDFYDDESDDDNEEDEDDEKEVPTA